jgi:hypothetical protein
MNLKTGEVLLFRRIISGSMDVLKWLRPHLHHLALKVFPAEVHALFGVDPV